MGGTPKTTKIPQALAKATVLDLEGATHQLRDLWKRQPVVLVFLRHFA